MIIHATIIHISRTITIDWWNDLVYVEMHSVQLWLENSCFMNDIEFDLKVQFYRPREETAKKNISNNNGHSLR